MLERKELWAKLNPFESVESHMLKAGRVCRVLLKDSSLHSVLYVLRGFIETDLEEDEFINFISYVVAMHDIGKATPFFQSKDSDMKKRLQDEHLYDYQEGPIRHEKYSFYYFNSDLGEKHVKSKQLVEELGKLLEYHHYKWDKGYTEEIYDDFWTDVVLEIEDIIYKEFTFSNIIKFNIKHKSGFYNILLGLLIISDWVASTSEVSNKDEINFKSKNDIYTQLLRYGFLDTECNFKKLTYDNLLGINSVNLRPLQSWTINYLDKHKPDFMLIEAGTGEGKTSVALYSAFQCMKETEGFYYALPMEVMVNSKYAELEGICSQELGIHTTLLHRNRELVEGANIHIVYPKEIIGEDAIEVSNFLTSSSKRGLLNKYIVGTIDQLLYAVLNSKFNALRILGLINKTLILDEIHAYDTYTGTMICKLLEVCRLYNIRVIMMSATLPSKLKEKYISAYTGEKVTLKTNGYPLVTVVENGKVEECQVLGSEKFKAIKVKKEQVLDNLEIQTDLIYNAYKQGGAIIVYKNTVKEAQELYSNLKGKGIEDLLLCHSKFKLKDRRSKENFIAECFGKDSINRPNQYIVVATQVLEACLDLDFDMCFSDIAPIDILIQRLGRVCRFDISSECVNRGTLCIFTSDNFEYGSTKYIYPEIYLRNTEDYLLNISNLELPDVLREAIESVYSSVSCDESAFACMFEQMQKDNITQQLAINQLINVDANIYKLEIGNKNISTRLNDNICVIVLDKSEMKSYDLEDITPEDYKKLIPNSFNTYPDTNLDGVQIKSGRLKGKYLLYMEGGEFRCGKKVYSYSEKEGYRVKSI